MSNSLKRAILRQEKNIDIEITVVINVVNNTPVLAIAAIVAVFFFIPQSPNIFVN